MVTFEEVESAKKVREEAERRNPLLKLGLGELVLEMQKIFTLDSNVLGPENEIPEESKDLYVKYISIVREISRREALYSSYKPAPRLG